MTTKDPVKLGLLKATKLPKNLDWVGAIELRLLIELRGYPDGLSRKQVANRFNRYPDRFVRFETSGLVAWQNDRKGQPSILVLTWQGQELSDEIYSRAIAAQKQAAAEAKLAELDVKEPVIVKVADEPNEKGAP